MKWAYRVVGLLGPIAAVVAIEYCTYELPNVGVLLDGILNTVDEKAIDLLVQETSQLVTIAFSIMGALAYFLTKLERKPLPYDLVLLYLSSGACIASVYCGHQLNTALVDMLMRGFLQLDASVVVIHLRAQYLLILLAAGGLVAYLAEHSRRLPTRPVSDDLA